MFLRLDGVHRADSAERCHQRHFQRMNRIFGSPLIKCAGQFKKRQVTTGCHVKRLDLKREIASAEWNTNDPLGVSSVSHVRQPEDLSRNGLWFRSLELSIGRWGMLWTYERTATYKPNSRTLSITRTFLEEICTHIEKWNTTRSGRWIWWMASSWSDRPRCGARWCTPRWKTGKVCRSWRSPAPGGTSSSSGIPAGPRTRSMRVAAAR